MQRVKTLNYGCQKMTNRKTSMIIFVCLQLPILIISYISPLRIHCTSLASLRNVKEGDISWGIVTTKRTPSYLTATLTSLLSSDFGATTLPIRLFVNGNTDYLIDLEHHSRYRVSCNKSLTSSRF